MTTTEFDSILARIVQEETELQFESFSNDDALQLGLALVQFARGHGHAVTIDICRGLQQLFHFAFAGTNADNDQWVIRKNRTVVRFGRSSLAIGKALARDGITIEERYCVSETEYATHGGAFPLSLKGTGPIGTITVSGLAQEDDHGLIVEVLREFLKTRGKG
ncbi:MAG: heme-degrading domain-containing protein [Rectinemataceae bacterium]|jgi:uncharacterized protein (UPF0303 family)